MSWYLGIGSRMDNQRSQSPWSCRNKCLCCHITLIGTKLSLEYVDKLLSPLYLPLMCRELTAHGSAAFSSSLVMKCSSNARPGSSTSPRLPAHLCKVWQWGGAAAGSSSAWGGKIWGFTFGCSALSFRRTLLSPLLEANQLLYSEKMLLYVLMKKKSLLTKQVCLCSASSSNTAMWKAISPRVLIICGAAALLCKRTGL